MNAQQTKEEECADVLILTLTASSHCMLHTRLKSYHFDSSYFYLQFVGDMLY